MFGDNSKSIFGGFGAKEQGLPTSLPTSHSSSSSSGFNFGQSQASTPAQAYPQGPSHNFGQGFQPLEVQHGYGQNELRRTANVPDLSTRVRKFLQSQQWFQSLPQNMQNVFKISHQEIATYFGGFFMIVGGWYLLSNGGAGTVVPLSAAIQFMGFLMVFLKAKMSNSVAGICPQTLHIWLAGILCRLSVNVIIFWSDHADSYLPSDGTCDWAYQVLEMGSMFTIIALLYEIHVVHRVNIAAAKLSPVIIFACLLLSVVIHPKLNNCWSNLRFAAGQYLEGAAMIPQVVQMARDNGKVEALTSHYIACSFVAQAMMFTWWWNVQNILTTPEYPSTIPAKTLLLFSAASVLLLGDFMYQYVKAAIKNLEMNFLPFDV